MTITILLVRCSSGTGTTFVQTSFKNLITVKICLILNFVDLLLYSGFLVSCRLLLIATIFRLDCDLRFRDSTLGRRPERRTKECGRTAGELKSYSCFQV